MYEDIKALLLEKNYDSLVKSMEKDLKWSDNEYMYLYYLACNENYMSGQFDSKKGIFKKIIDEEGPTSIYMLDHNISVALQDNERLLEMYRRFFLGSLSPVEIARLSSLREDISDDTATMLTLMADFKMSQSLNFITALFQVSLNPKLKKTVDDFEKNENSLYSLLDEDESNEEDDENEDSLKGKSDITPLPKTDEDRLNDLLKEEKYTECINEAKKCLSEGKENAYIYYYLFLAGNSDYHSMDFSDIHSEMFFNKALEDSTLKKKINDEFTFYKMLSPSLRKAFCYAERSNAISFGLLLENEISDTISVYPENTFLALLREFTENLTTTISKSLAVMAINLLYIVSKKNQRIFVFLLDLIKEYSKECESLKSYTVFEGRLTLLSFYKKYFMKDGTSTDDVKEAKYLKILESLQKEDEENNYLIITKAISDLGLLGDYKESKPLLFWCQNKKKISFMKMNEKLGRNYVILDIMKTFKNTDDAPEFIKGFPQLMVSDADLSHFKDIVSQEEVKNNTYERCRKAIREALDNKDAKEFRTYMAKLKSLGNYKFAETLLEKYQKEYEEKSKYWV